MSIASLPTLLRGVGVLSEGVSTHVGFLECTLSSCWCSMTVAMNSTLLKPSAVGNHVLDLHATASGSRWRHAPQLTVGGSVHSHEQHPRDMSDEISFSPQDVQAMCCCLAQSRTIALG